MIIKGKKKPNALIILDGWGIAPAWGGNAISRAKTKIFDRIWQDYPSTTILASGEAVGLPTNSPGNSEAGHLNIGAGHVVHQDVTLIDQKIDDKSFFENTTLKEALNHAVSHRSNIHLVGLLSKAGTHSHLKHLYALLLFFKKNNFSRVFIDLFSDGRDSDPMSGIEMVDELEIKIREIGVGKISSISGRFFAMDRDRRWGRIARAYNLLVSGEGNVAPSARSAFSSAYAAGQTDEFIEPKLISSKTQEKVTIKNDDAIIFFNLRSDRTRQLTDAFLSPRLPQFPDRKKLNNLFFATFVLYENLSSAKRVFSPEKILTPLGKVWSDQGLRQFHTAETEKYPHITYFINGNVNDPFPGEDRVVAPSPRNVKTYDLCPKMNALGVTKNVLLALSKNSYDALVINYANADMVGHTGNLEAAVHAAEFVDQCLGKVLEKILELGGTAFVMSDHGNAEQMVNPRTGSPDTEHTTNPVPFIIVSADEKNKNIILRNDGILATVSPTVLETMGIKRPPSMVNQSIIINQSLVNAK